MRTLLISITLLFVACTGPSEISEQIEGSYKFNFPSGQIEILEIKNPNTFNHEIYLKEIDYLNKNEPIYKNEGTWVAKEKKLLMANWLTICYLGANPDSILPQPFYFDMFDVTWHASSGSAKSYINVYQENGYVLEKIN